MNSKLRRILLPLLLALVVVGAVSAAVVAGGDSAVTSSRLERSLPSTFAHQYVDWAHLQGRNDVTVSSLHAKAMCEKGGPAVADIGPGSDWICLMSWKDPQVPMPTEGYGKFELNVHTNACYTAGGPSKLTGLQTMTDAKGREVNNPVYEFDGCFDPNSTNADTGVTFPSLLSVTSTAVRRAPDGTVPIRVICSNGAGGCAGTVKVTAGNKTLGTVPFDLQEVHSASLAAPAQVPAGTKELTYTFTYTRGVGSTSPVTLSLS